MIEPSTWQKKMGATPVFVEFPQPRMAAITGPSSILEPFATGERLPLALAPTAESFGTFLSGQLLRFYFLLAFVFIIFFLGIAFGVPKGSTMSFTAQPSSAQFLQR